MSHSIRVQLEESLPPYSVEDKPVSSIHKVPSYNTLVGQDSSYGAPCMAAPPSTVYGTPSSSLSHRATHHPRTLNQKKCLITTVTTLFFSLFFFVGVTFLNKGIEEKNNTFLWIGGGCAVTSLFSAGAGTIAYRSSSERIPLNLRESSSESTLLLDDLPPV